MYRETWYVLVERPPKPLPPPQQGIFETVLKACGVAFLLLFVPLVIASYAYIPNQKQTEGTGPPTYRSNPAPVAPGTPIIGTPR